MRRFIDHDVVRLFIVALGASSLLVSAGLLWNLCSDARTDGIVEVYTVVEHGRTNPHTTVTYLHPNGARYSFEVPPIYPPGETVRVLFDRRYPKAAVVDSLGGWRRWDATVGFGIAGVFLISIGIFRRSQPKGAVASSDANVT